MPSLGTVRSAFPRMSSARDIVGWSTSTAAPPVGNRRARDLARPHPEGPAEVQGEIAAAGFGGAPGTDLDRVGIDDVRRERLLEPVPSPDDDVAAVDVLPVRIEDDRALRDG